MDCRKLPFLAPVLFTIVMGTGAFAIASLEMAELVPWLYWPALCLNYGNYLLFLILAVWAITSWRNNLQEISAHFNTPAACALYSACGLALLVLGAQALRFDLGVYTALWLWCAGALLCLGLNLAIMLRFFIHPGLELAHFTPVFFIPIAGLVVIPVAGAPLAALMQDWVANIITLVCILAMGSGIALYSGLFSILLQRHLLASPLPGHLAATFWIHLAPAGWSGVSLLALAQYVLTPEYAAGARLVALLLFGISFWWLIMVILIGAHAVLKKQLTFNMSWWAFVFPTGAITILSRNLEIASLKSLFPLLWCLLALLWLLCACKTVAVTGRKLLGRQK